MTNEKREQARVLEEMLGGYTCLPEHQVNPAQLSRHRRHSAALRAGIAALMREPESTAPDVSEAERPKRLCDYDPVETTVGDMVMRFGFDYTNFKFFAESITKLTAALRREAEAATAPDVSEAFKFDGQSLQFRIGNKGDVLLEPTDDEFIKGSRVKFIPLPPSTSTGVKHLLAALRAAHKRKGEAVALLRRVHEKVIQGSFDGVVAVDDFIVRFLAARNPRTAKGDAGKRAAAGGDRNNSKIR